MKRFAYLLSNSNGLPGIKKDISDFRAFLLSCEGGAWNSDEIVERQNLRLEELRRDLRLIRLKNYDYCIFYYSGHGSYKRDNRLYINDTDENIGEYEVVDLSIRQLSVFDCCRVEERQSEKRTYACDEAFNSNREFRQYARDRFERQVQSVVPQKNCLYACKIGECAIATGDGSIYTQSLLLTARSLCTVKDVDAITVHRSCCANVTRSAKINGGFQHPESSVSPVSDIDGTLPFAIRKPQLMVG